MLRHPADGKSPCQFLGDKGMLCLFVCLLFCLFVCVCHFVCACMCVLFVCLCCLSDSVIARLIV